MGFIGNSLWCMQEVWGVSSKSLIQEAEVKKKQQWKNTNSLDLLKKWGTFNEAISIQQFPCWVDSYLV